ncbi:glycoside hydrolase family 15 protein [Halobaculum sp. CBA1158]|uniref:glycoside hydrolase family 15 protein n=1 Tax=Halobaculum sp. CBA1158 TaxID=2904243 RepID=UPI001F374361|nr:glycoside hydrolase family 15 protein [Halobaculum sp. CBA1158]UIO99054.1 glycoside hydrolase family 15 protein [Halobaculum sp. CBA1158]
MRLRTALNDYKRAGGHGAAGTASTVRGGFSGRGERLVHVDPAGGIRDFSAALSGLSGIDRSRFGIETGERTYWFDDLETVRQHHYRETTLVETEYDAGEFTVHQYDLTLGRAHATHVELRGSVPSEARLVAFLTFAPEGRETRVGRLIHEGDGPAGGDAMEVFHREEHDYVTASTGLDDVRAQVPERFEEILDPEPVSLPREGALNRYEDTHLSGDAVVTAPLERAGRGLRTTLVTLLADNGQHDRERVLADLRECAREHAGADELRTVAHELAAVAVDEDGPRRGTVRADLRALDLLAAPSGARIAGPEFDPFFRDSGGYGYTWFRDDARISGQLLAADEPLGLGVETAELARSARFYCETQRPDGSWPHRVWASDGSLAPGWANARVEGRADSDEYQADQTATTVAFLAALLRERGDELSADDETRIRAAVAAGVDSLDESRRGDGLPERCQNLWEDSAGRFAHTAATFLEAYAAVARAPVDATLRERAREGASATFDGLERLWDADEGRYARRLADGERDGRLDAATVALVEAAAAYDAVEGLSLADDDLDRLVDHVEATLAGLYRDPDDSAVAGLIRYEGDGWRTDGQDGEKVWTLATGMGATGAATLGGLLADRGRGETADRLFEQAADLYELLEENGPLTTAMGYLPEQWYDDGTADSATPLGYAHGFRLRATAALAERDALPSAAASPSPPTDRPRWTTGEKYGVGTAADHDADEPSRMWFTLTQGALTEVRFPRVDLMNLRTLDFIVSATDEEYTVRTHVEGPRTTDDTVERRVEPTADDALLFRHVVAETGDGRGHEWELTVEYAVDPSHDALVADIDFRAVDDAEYDVFAVADAALTNTGTRDRALRLGTPGSHHLVARDAGAYTGEGGEGRLVDENGDGYSVAVAMATADRFDWATVCAAGGDDLTTLFTEGTVPETRESIDDDNVVLVGRVGTGRRTAETLALGFARQADAAAALGEAAGALAHGYEGVRESYRDTWRAFLADKPLPASVAGDDALANQYRTALMTLRAVEDKTYRGASVASPSVPWGEAVDAAERKGYGYNFVWARDLYQVFTAAELTGDLETAANQLAYIYEYQQDEDGFIPQNTYLNGVTRWGGEQMDNISFPAVMAYHLWADGLDFEDVAYDFEHVRRSADYVARNGPESAQERWEEEAGYSPSSIAAEIAGLACAGKLALEVGDEASALVWLALSDRWADEVESWTATETGTERHEHTPYYVRVTRDGDPEAGHLRTLANDGPRLDERDVIDAGFLELVRLGIKPWDDETVRNSVREVDDTIRVDLPAGAAFYRYNGDGYGERDEENVGAPWSVDNHGKGRLWPLLTGERGEYELHAFDDDRAVDADADDADADDADADDADADDEGGSGRDPALEPTELLRTMQRFANSGRMIAEQVWDRDYPTEYDWGYGEGTGSATPLAWSMAQFVRLAHGIDADEPAETPAFVRERFLERRLHEGDEKPALRVDTNFQGNTVVVSGETTGARVAVTTPVDSAAVDPEGGRFEVRLDIGYGENDITVAAAADEDVERAATTVTRFTV